MKSGFFVFPQARKKWQNITVRGGAKEGDNSVEIKISTELESSLLIDIYCFTGII